MLVLKNNKGTMKVLNKYHKEVIRDTPTNSVKFVDLKRGGFAVYSENDKTVSVYNKKREAKKEFKKRCK